MTTGQIIETDNFYGSVSSGMEMDLPNGARLAASAEYQGIGSGNFEAISAMARLSIPLGRAR